ncbi:MAG: hypothetical protein ACK4S4_15090, partial [Pyrinomonadaceae bacterium]
MKKQNVFRRSILVGSVFLIAAAGAVAQDKAKVALAVTDPVLWEDVNIPARDLFYGPGGREMVPDVSRVTFIKEE